VRWHSQFSKAHSGGRFTGHANHWHDTCSALRGPMCDDRTGLEFQLSHQHSCPASARGHWGISIHLSTASKQCNRILAAVTVTPPTASQATRYPDPSYPPAPTRVRCRPNNKRHTSHQATSKCNGTYLSICISHERRLNQHTHKHSTLPASTEYFSLVNLHLRRS
jgi:hypothetical protein